MRRIVRRRGITALLEVAFALVTLAVVMMAPGDGPTGTARVELSRAAGTLSLGNSREGSAIFHALNMRPGQQAGGSVRVTNTGALPAVVTLALTAEPRAGAASPLLAARLHLAVLDVTDAGRPVTRYAGPLATMPATSLGALAAGHGRDFLFVSTLPEGGAADNALQGATFAAGFSWTAVASTPPATTPTPTPKPRPTPTPVPTVTPTPAPPAGTCKPRKVRIRIRRWHGHRARRVKVKVGHKHAHRAKLRHGKVTVKVRGHKRVRIKVTVLYAGGHHKVIHRRARGRCAPAA